MSLKSHYNHFIIIFLGLNAALAQAQQVTPATGPDTTKGLLLNLPIFAALGLLFYLGLIRPQQAQAKKQVSFLLGLKKGEEVITTGGVIGRIEGLTDKVISLQISPQTEIKVMRSQIQSYLKDVISA